MATAGGEGTRRCVVLPLLAQSVMTVTVWPAAGSQDQTPAWEALWIKFAHSPIQPAGTAAAGSLPRLDRSAPA